MKRTCFWSVLSVLFSVLVLGFSPAFGDDAHPATLDEVHKILLQAAGYDAAVPPTPDEQSELLHHALDRIRHIPHVYHGQLNRASREINAALDELSNGDAAHKAREDIFNAADQIKSIM